LLSERQKEILEKSAVGIAAPTAGEKSTTILTMASGKNNQPSELGVHREQ